ncbi:MAG: hypothetical protein U0L26_08225, partial [Cellulosilyticum sp.]|nr:hypothetical protein [Cellulosilyticum sp.]
MNVRKIIAISLVFFMTIGILPEGLLANDQNPIQEIEKVTVSHQVTNVVGQELSIVPKIQVDWIAPLDNEIPIDSTDNDQKKASHYDFSFTNLNDANNTDKKEILASKFGNAAVLSMNAQDYFKNFFKNGALYKLQITAKHKHKVVVDNKTTYVDSNLSTFYPNPTKYFLTDFNLQANASEGLTFSWEYVPGMSYYLYYEKGNKESISEMSGAGREITAEEAKNSLNEDGTRVVYTVEKAVPGQIYSAYILPIGLESTEVRFDELEFNSTTPKLIHVTPNIPLTVEPLGSSKVRLSWDITQAAWVSVGNKLYQTVIYQIDSKGEKTELGRIYNDNKGNQDVGYFECASPTEAVTYVVDFILKNTAGNLEVGFSAGPKKYVPDELREVPYQPYIPEIFNYKASDSVSSHDITTQDKYKVKFNGRYNDLVLDIN